MSDVFVWVPLVCIGVTTAAYAVNAHRFPKVSPGARDG